MIGALRAFSFGEKLLIGLVSLCIVFGTGYWLVSLYRHFTVELPDFGGKYQEGCVGQPLTVNPLLSPGNPADADLVRLVYAGLFKYDKTGALVGDLAEDQQISDDGLEYTVFLRKNLTWHDGEPLTADDVIFTFEILQNPIYHSPLRKKWPDGAKMEKIDDTTIKFVLSEPSSNFSDALTIGIVPKHIWNQVNPERFALSTNNLAPIGAGPYQYVSASKDEEGNITAFTLRAFPGYHAGRPFIKDFSIMYYLSEDTLVEAYKRKEIKGMRELPVSSIDALGDAKKTTRVYDFTVPEYYAVFFNQTKSKALAYDEVRKALSLVVDRGALLREAAGGKGVPVQGPFLPGETGYRDDVLQSTPNMSEAERILEEAGWKKGDDGIRVKNGVRLEFALTTADWGNLASSAQSLKTQWEALGAKVETQILDTYDLSQNHIRPKEYEALLYVQAPGSNPNLFAYWHSTQKDGDGLNLSLFSNKSMDEVLEKTKTATKEEDRAQLFAQFQDIFAQKNPAVYLYATVGLYPVSDKVYGIKDGHLSDFSDRFSDVSKWYMETRREFK